MGGFFASAAGKWTTRRAALSTWATPGALAQAINPRIVQTPALDLIDENLMWAYSTPDARLIISMPPQEGKSERVTKTGPLWKLTRAPDTRIALASYAQALAEGFGRDIRNWVTSNSGEEGTLDLGLRIARDNGAARRWSLAGRPGGVISVGIESGFTGRAAEVLHIDDPIADREQAESEWHRQKVWDWWQAVASTRLAPGAPVVLVLTRWHEDDLAGRLLSAEDGHLWRILNIPALADHDPEKGQTDPLGREPGQWLQSARRRTPEQWEAIRVRAGSQVFASLYQGRPSPSTGDVWERQWWRRYTTILWSVQPDGAYRVRDMDEVIQSWDLTFKDTKSSDFVCGQVWARRGAEVFLLDHICRRMSFTETVAAVKAMCRKWPDAVAKLIEDKANGPAVIDSLRQKIPGIIPVEPRGSKYARAVAVSPFLQAGNVAIPASSTTGLFDPGPLVEEAAAFPHGAHDDQVDATSQALSRLLLHSGQGHAWLEWVRKKNADHEAERDAQQNETEGTSRVPA